MNEINISFENGRELIGLRASSRFFLDSYRLSRSHINPSIDHLDNIEISSQVIPRTVNLLFSYELLMKLAYLTDIFLKDKDNFKISDQRKYLKNDISHNVSKIRNHSWTNKDFHSYFSKISQDDIKKYDGLFAKLRYLFENNGLKISDIDFLYKTATTLYDLILNVHSKSNDPILALYLSK